MRLASGVTDQYVYFVGVDAADLSTRLTGYAAKFTVYRSRNGGAAAAYTTPTINETDATNMAGVYELLVDEDTSIDAGDFSQEYALHIRDTGGHVAPVTRVIELFRPPGGDTGRLNVNAVELDSDTGFADRLGKMASVLSAAGQIDTGSVSGNLPANLKAIIADTGAADNLRGTYDGTNVFNPPVNVFSIRSDTGASTKLRDAFTNGFNDTGVNDRLGRILADVDTGLRAQISDVDTGLHDALSDLDTGLRDYVDNTDTGLRAFIDDLDTGVKNRFDRLAEDTGGVDITSIAGDTGAPGWLRDAFANGFNDTGLNDHLGRIRSDVDTGLRDSIADLDTGLRDYIDNTDTGLRAHIDDLDTGVKSRFDKMAEDTGGVNVNSIGGDTGAAAHLAQAFAEQATNSDTGLVANAAAIRNKTDSLTFTVTGQVDSNVQYVNDVQVSGTGASGDEWGPA